MEHMNLYRRIAAAAVALLAVTAACACEPGTTRGALIGDSIILKCDPQVRDAHPHDTWQTRDYGGTGFYSTPGFYDGITFDVDHAFVSIGVNDAIRWDQPADYAGTVDPDDYYNHVAELLGRISGTVYWTNVRLTANGQNGDDLERARVINDVLTVADFNFDRLHVVDYVGQADESWYAPGDDLHPTSPEGCEHWAAMFP